MSDDNLVDALGQVLGSYGRGTAPGLHPIEILDGAERGFSRVQARLILRDDWALDILRRHWDDNSPTQQIRAAAAEMSARGLVTREVLRVTGHERDVVLPEEQLSRLLQSHDAVDAGKGYGEEPVLARLSVIDEYTGARVLLTPIGRDDYRLTVVPETGAGPVRIVIRWAPVEFVVIDAQLEIGQPYSVTIAAPCDGVEPVAVSIVPAQ